MDPVLIDKIISGDSAAEISDFIKDSLFGKAAEKIDAIKPEVASSIFNSPLVNKKRKLMQSNQRLLLPFSIHLSVNKKLKQR